MRIQKTISLFLLFFTLLAVLLTACGGGNTSSDTNSQDNTSANTTETPVQLPAGVTIALKDAQIVSSQTTFKPGVAYSFVVANVGKKHHGFVIVPTTVNVAQMTTADLQKSALVFVDDLAPGKTATMNYTFLASAVGVSYVMTSQLPGDAKAGLKVSISVKP